MLDSHTSKSISPVPSPKDNGNDTTALKRPNKGGQLTVDDRHKELVTKI